MADKKISQLTAATTPLAGTEVVPLVQSGVTKKVAVSDLVSLGSVVQTVSVSSPTVVTTTSASILTLNITPKKSSNKILLISNCSLQITANTNALGVMQFLRNGNAIFVGPLGTWAIAGDLAATTKYVNLASTYLDSPATTSSIQYDLLVGRGSINTTSVTTSGIYTLTALEISA